ncbi:hypothetical protein [Paraburkholderia phenazinium]|uniref:Uncharacterized protein n=1 Tax=Paraburkholderia phenazinium TaxID=60549 RepID=A0A1N6KYL1_9BURK|nr:hypothetical protein [Paraburkholderia phenazinium]SIO61516.1 hypothetical protein SAMN05444165_5257 [Paraburkholderia phenazinium]
MKSFKIGPDRTVRSKRGKIDIHRGNMQENDVAKQPALGRITVGYLLSVTAATTCIFGWALGRAILHRSEDGLLLPISGTLFVILTDCFTFPLLWLPAMLLSAVPCSLLFVITQRWQISNLIFYVIAGVSIGLVSALIVVHLTHNWSWYTDTPNSAPLDIWHEFLSISKLFGAAGAVAGSVFWLVAARLFRGN